MQEVERQLAAKFPTAKFSHFTYIVDTQEIDQDPDNFPTFKAWLDGVDCVVGVGARHGFLRALHGLHLRPDRAAGQACLPAEQVSILVLRLQGGVRPRLSRPAHRHL